jgi:hypothetical protein
MNLRVGFNLIPLFLICNIIGATKLNKLNKVVEFGVNRCFTKVGRNKIRLFF